jgi:serine/threonine protein kinase
MNPLRAYERWKDRRNAAQRELNTGIDTAPGVEEPSIDELQALGAVREAYKKMHHSFARVEPGGTKFVFSGMFGRRDWKGIKRAFKVNRNPQTETATRHMASGYTAENEAKMLCEIASRVKDNPHTSQIISWEDLTPFGYPGMCIEETWIDGESLERKVMKERRILSERESRRFVPQFADAVAFNIRHGIYHRDVKPSNVIIGENGVGLIDYANSIEADKTTAKMLPSAGGHFVMDPNLLGVFTGEERKYSEQSEHYQFGTTLLWAFRGKYIVEYDPIKKIAIRKDKTGPDASLLTDGKLDNKKHDAAIKDAVDKLPAYAKRYGRIIQRCMTLNEADSDADIKRYSSIDELMADVKEASTPTKFERMRTHWKQLAATGTAVLALTAGVGKITLNYVQQTNAQIEEGNKIAIIPHWSTSPAEITNNAVTLKIEAQGLIRTDHDTQHMIRPAGERELELLITPEAAPRVRKVVTSAVYPGRAYIEGTEGTYFEAMELRRDASEGYEADPRTPVRLDISRLHEGAYNLAVELYPPTPLERMGNNNDLHKEFRMKEGQTISRKTVTLVIGDRSKAVSLDDVRVDPWTNFISGMFRNPVDPLNDRWCEASLATAETSMPELSYRSASKSNLIIPEQQRGVRDPSLRAWCTSTSLSLPPTADALKLPDASSREYTLVSTLKADGKTAFYTGLPIELTNPYNEIFNCSEQEKHNSQLLVRLGLRRQEHTCPQERTWRLRIPDKNFYKTLMKYAPADMPWSGYTR